MTQQKLPQLRRLSQIVFLLLFLLLMMKTESFSSLRAVRDGVRLPYPVSFFLQLDPLAALASALSSHTLYRGLLWSLAILIPTFFLGRFFCGWICPLGTLNHFLSSWKSERKRGPERLERNRYKKWQTLKYYLLIAGLVSALFGGSLIGILDPISLTVRSLGTSVFPAINYALDALLGALHHSPAAPLRTVGYVAQLVLNETLLSFRQPHFRQAFFLGAIFIALLVLNLRITRFWCRALCPLGALLGIVSRWSILGLEKHPDHCDDCNRCLLDCQGGDDPLPQAKWRKAECHLCFNCVGECPESGIHFKFFPATPTTHRQPQLAAPSRASGSGGGRSAVADSALGPGIRGGQGSAPDPAARGARREELSGALHSLRRVHEGVPQQRLAAGAAGSGPGGLVDARARAAHRLLRAQLRALRRGVPHGRHLGNHPGGESLAARERRQGRQTHPSGHGFLRPRALPALGDGHGMHRVRGVVPHVPQGHLPASRRGDGFRWGT